MSTWTDRDLAWDMIAETPTNQSFQIQIAEYASALAAERQRVEEYCERCTWAWYPTGEYPWRCVRCSNARRVASC